MIHLSVPDNRESKHALVFDMAKRLDLLPPVYIVSHKRSHEMRTLRTLPALREVATVVINEEELLDYQIDLPGVQLLAIPAGYKGHSGGLGRSRQFVLDTAHALGQERIVVLDDDLKRLTILFSLEDGDRVSRTVLGAVGAKLVPEFYLGVLVLTAQLAEEAFRDEPTAIIASPQCNNANRTIKSSVLRWETNRGGPPSQIQVWDVPRWMEYCGEIDLDRFNWHGEDISIMCQIVQAGGTVVSIPAIVGEWSDYETESVIRTPETAPALRQTEHDHLMNLELAPYIKTRTDLIGRPQWHSLNWLALAKDGITEHNARYWVDPDPRYGDLI